MLTSGKYSKIEKNNPLAVGRCDTSGFIARRKDLVKQYEFRGNGLVWTGFWVLKRFLDQPNPQLLTPKILADPYPIPNPRPDTTNQAGFEN